MLSTKIRFENKVLINTDGCWIWTGYIGPGGYGRFRFNGKTCQAHRAAYEIYVGGIGDGLHIDHLCGVRSCVNPKHLEAVLQAENNRRSSKTHKICEHGTGYSVCKLGCSKEYYRQYREKNKSKLSEYFKNYYLQNLEVNK